MAKCVEGMTGPRMLLRAFDHPEAKRGQSAFCCKCKLRNRLVATFQKPHEKGVRYLSSPKNWIMVGTDHTLTTGGFP